MSTPDGLKSAIARGQMYTQGLGDTHSTEPQLPISYSRENSLQLEMPVTTNSQWYKPNKDTQVAFTCAGLAGGGWYLGDLAAKALSPLSPSWSKPIVGTLLVAAGEGAGYTVGGKLLGLTMKDSLKGACKAAAAAAAFYGAGALGTYIGGAGALGALAALPFIYVFDGVAWKAMSLVVNKASGKDLLDSGDTRTASNVGACGVGWELASLIPTGDSVVGKIAKGALIYLGTAFGYKAGGLAADGLKKCCASPKTGQQQPLVTHKVFSDDTV